MRKEIGAFTITDESSHGTAGLLLLDWAPFDSSLVTITFKNGRFLRVEIGKGYETRWLVIIEDKTHPSGNSG